MIPFILYFSNYIGAVMLGNSPDLVFSTDITLVEAGKYLYQYILGSFVLAIGSAVIVTLISYLILSLTIDKKHQSTEIK